MMKIKLALAISALAVGSIILAPSANADVWIPAPKVKFTYYAKIGQPHVSGIKEKVCSLSKTDQRYLERALALAALSDQKHRHGALIVRGGHVYGAGFNTQRNLPHDNLSSYDYTYHAEQVALRNCSMEILAGAKLYIARLSRRGYPALSRPCDTCMTKILKVGIKEIIYTTSVR